FGGGAGDGGSFGGGFFDGGNFGGGSFDGGNFGGGAGDGGNFGGGAAGGTGGGAADAGVCVPSQEVCDGIDNNCNQVIDEGLTIACSLDPDGDLNASSAATTLMCPNPARPLAGNCPVGFVAPSASLGLDCAPNDASAYRLLGARTDADDDTRCVGPVGQDCIGLVLAPGRRATATCAPQDDCDDTSAVRFQLLSTRADADNDSFCAGAPTNECSGLAPALGRRLATSCVGDDCDDTRSSAFSVSSFIVDADGDRYCSGVVVSQCAGNTAPPGLSFPFNCITQTDCNDMNPSIYRLLAVRPDGDNDGYCFGPTTNQCSGASPPMGFRLPGTCNAVDDCRDTNPLATSQCVLLGAYTTSSATKACAFAPPTETFTVSPTNICPLGFVLGTTTTVRTAGAGSCAVASPTSITMTCIGLDGATCHISGSCLAL
ncbi:MAG: hypothetical protein IAE78_15325, partial [Myxococcus sp.]|nr:hypothetical protein [Myxococcus sp.]